MKKFFKLVPAALALFALASCNSEDIFESKSQIADLSDKSTLTVTVEPIQGEYATRAVSNADVTAVNFEDNDQITVYDKDLHKYDWYKFVPAAEKFVLDGANDVMEPEFALYPKANVITTFWTKGSEASKTTAQIRLDNVINYREAKMADGTTGYLNDLPQWGAVKGTDGKLEADLHYLTAFLRIKLAHVQDNVSSIYVVAYSDPDLTSGKEINIAGNFNAILDIDDVSNTALSEFANDPWSSNGTVGITSSLSKTKFIEVKIPASSSKKIDDNSVLLVPIPAGLTGYVALFADANTTPFKVLSKKTYKRNTRYGVSETEFSTPGQTPKAIGDLLKKATATAGVVTVSATAATQVTAGTDYQIVIPAGIEAETVKINLQSINGNIEVVNENEETPFAGNVVLNIAGSTSNNIEFNLVGAASVALAGAYTGKVNVYADEFVLGDGTTTTSIAASNLTLSPSQIKTLTVKEKATLSGAYTFVAKSNIAQVVVEGTVSDLDATTNNPTVKPSVTVQGKGVAGDIKTAAAVTVNSTQSAATTAHAGAITTTADVTIGGKGAIGAVLTSNGKVTAAGEGAIASISAKNAVEISGKRAVTGDVTSSDGGVTSSTEGTIGGKVTAKSDISISGKCAVTSDINSNAGAVSLNSSANTTFAGAVSAKTNVTLAGKSHVTGKIVAQGNLDISGTANAADADVYGDATVNVDAQDGKCEAILGTLTFKNGNKTLNLTQGYIKQVAAHASVSDKLTFGTGAAWTAIGTVTGKLTATNASIWNGSNVPSFASIANYFNKGGDIWTANQLGYQAQTDQTDGFALKVNVNMNSKNFKGIKLANTAAATVDGNGFTISNLNLTSNNAATGLIATADKEVTVNNLTLDGVTIANPANTNIGAVIGKASDAANLNRISIKFAGTQFGRANAAKTVGLNIGGAIGYAVGATTIKGITVDANNVPIKGYAYMGGIIGKADGNVTINNIAASSPYAAMGVTVSNLSMNVIFKDTDAKNDPNQGRWGYYIGSIDLNKTVTISPAQTGLSFEATGADMAACYIKVTIGGTDKSLTYVRDATQPWIGYSGNNFTSQVETPIKMDNIQINGNKYQMITDKITTNYTNYSVFGKFNVADWNE